MAAASSSPRGSSPLGSPKGRALWSDLKDKLHLDSSLLESPWAKHKLHDLPAQRIIHHLYDVDRKVWSQVEGLAKMQTEPWDNGAMRKCYRALVSDPHAQDGRLRSLDWKKMPPSVVKRYKKVPKSDLEFDLASGKATTVRRTKGATKSTRAATKHSGFSVGQAVEANYSGSGSWYSAVVKAFDGEKNAYTVYYPEDDETESLPPNFLRAVKGAPAAAAAAAAAATTTFAVGEEVEAAYQGSDSAWYDAVVRVATPASQHGAERYTVFYPEDDETEEGLPVTALRRKKNGGGGGGSSTAPGTTSGGGGGGGGGGGEEEEEEEDKDADPLVEVPREVYFADVKLQMATKQWEDHFNRRKPPKRTQFLHCHAIELVPAGAGPDWRSGSGEVLAVERFIEGEYIKHKVSSAQFRRPLRHLLDRAID